LGLAPTLLAELERLHFTVPTPIQAQAIPVAVEGKDIIGIAQTGTGKTLAFALPMLQQVARTKRRGFILLPTRELAMQVDEMLHAVGKSLGLRTALLIGGMPMQRQVAAIRRKPHVLIGTPGRILDHLQQGTLHLKDIGVLVLDEADRMLDMGFAPQISKILHHVPRERQTMLFSATMPPAIVSIASRHMKMPVRVEVAPAGTVASRVNQDLFIVKKEEKNRLLGKLLSEYAGSVLVFSRTKHGAKRICRSLRAMGHNVAEIHSNLSLARRRKSLEGFKAGTYRVLVATDIAARGIDVHDIEVVINYDLPDNPHDYVNRVGRTGRAGREGQAITFITPDQRGKIRSIERLVRTSLRISPLPDLPAHPASVPHDTPRAERRPSSRGHRHSS
jgi:ATP-dependent RNA helicase RhlE